MSVLDRFFGLSYDKELKQLQPIVTEINSLEESYEELTPQELKKKKNKCY